MMKFELFCLLLNDCFGEYLNVNEFSEIFDANGDCELREKEQVFPGGCSSLVNNMVLI